MLISSILLNIINTKKLQGIKEEKVKASNKSLTNSPNRKAKKNETLFIDSVSFDVKIIFKELKIVKMIIAR